MVWKESYKIGVEMIDQQHKMLFVIADRLQKSFNNDKTTQEMANTLKFLVEYVNFHFSAEEKLMAHIRYPFLAHQKSQHAIYKDKIAQYLKDLKGGHELNVYRVLDFITSWISDHILGEDREIGDYIKQRRIDLSSFSFKKEETGNEEVEIVLGMKRLKALYDKKMLKPDEFRKNEVFKINEYITLAKTEKLEDVEAILGILEYLAEEQLIGEAEQSNYKAILFEKLNLHQVIKGITTDSERLEHLKVFVKQGLITEEEIKGYLTTTVT